MALVPRHSFGLQMKLTGVFAALAAICAVIFMGIMILSFRGLLREDLNQHALDIAAIAAGQIDGSALAEAVAAADASAPGYTALQAKLDQIRQASAGLRSVYTVYPGDGGRWLYGVGSADQPGQPGDLVTQAGPALSAQARAIAQPIVEKELTAGPSGSYLSAYAPIFTADSNPVGALVIDLDARNLAEQERGLLRVALLILAAAVPGSLAAGFCLSLLVIRPIQRVARATRQLADEDLPALVEATQAIAAGDLTCHVALRGQPVIYRAKDELGDLANATNQITTRLQEVGQSFDTMSAKLRALVGQVVENANQVNASAAQLSSVADQAGQATHQIATTIQQVARGTAQQTQAITQTTVSVEQMSRAIDGVAKGAQEQAYAVNKASEMTAQINQRIGEVTESAQAVSQASLQAAATARSGAQKVQATLKGMQAIKNDVSRSAEKVSEMGKRSEQIGDIVETIDEIAGQTNLLSVNAAIETARSETQAHVLTENLLNRQMIIQAELLNQLLCESRNTDRSTTYWGHLATQTHLDSICITDEDGMIIYSNEGDLLGFRFPDDPRAQAYVFRKLIHQEGSVCQAPQRRSKDNQVFKYIGVHRRDQPGVVQVGFMSDTVAKFTLQMGGFAVVASEVNRLAEQTRAAAKQISDLNRTIQSSVGDAMRTIQASVSEVESGVQGANQAGQALEEILSVVEGMARQADQSAGAARQMSHLAGSLVESVDSVSAVVEENTASTEEMAAGSQEVSQSIENIASVSQENSAAVEEVSASAEEMSAQVEEVSASAQALSEMAADLLALIQQFNLGDHTRLAKKSNGRQPMVSLLGVR